ncbi:unnamed protein product [Trichogramma brassicae]|uniref:Uncharacterized protein n=1 Tax=Trichogramma brassicae TaxID=86971 RepID=A0A6H5J219_9HYME|nr:unnamed protein product [Trichogramma brassicae]
MFLNDASRSFVSHWAFEMAADKLSKLSSANQDTKELDLRALLSGKVCNAVRQRHARIEGGERLVRIASRGRLVHCCPLRHSHTRLAPIRRSTYRRHSLPSRLLHHSRNL